jgi:hypothetical protein
MDHEPNDELLSAHIDGELSADELATVERWLASSAPARDRFEELRATSRTVQGLPRTALTGDFAEGVVERIRRESLVRPALAPTLVRRRHPAWWIGAPLAAAAALLIAVCSRGLPHRDEVRLAQNNVGREIRPAGPPGHLETDDLRPLAARIEPKLPDAGTVVVVHDRNHIRQVEVIVIDQVEGLNAIRGICVKHGIAFEEDSRGDATDGALSRQSDLATFIAIEASDEQLDRLLADAGTASPIVEFSVTAARERSLLEPRKLKVASTVRDEPQPAAVERPELASSTISKATPAEAATRRDRGAMPAGAAAGPAGEVAYRLGLMPSFAGQPPAPIVLATPGQMPAALASTDKRIVQESTNAARDAGSLGRAWVVQLLDEELAVAAEPAGKPGEPRTNTLKAVEKLHRFYAEGRDVLGAAPKERKTESAATRHMLLRLIEDPQAVRKEKRN